MLSRLFQRFISPRTDTNPAIAQSPGAAAENRAATHLANAGLTLRERNYRTRLGEIDLVMEHADVLVFVEVRYRRHTKYGHPAETVTAHKQRRLRAAAEHYLQQHRQDCNRPCRFDIVAITPHENGERIEWLRDAF